MRAYIEVEQEVDPDLPRLPWHLELDDDVVGLVLAQE